MISVKGQGVGRYWKVPHSYIYADALQGMFRWGNTPKWQVSNAKCCRKWVSQSPRVEVNPGLAEEGGIHFAGKRNKAVARIVAVPGEAVSEWVALSEIKIDSAVSRRHR